MSASDEKIEDEEDDENEDQNDVVSIGKNQRTKSRFGVFQRQFSKAKSKFRRIKSKRVLLPSSSLSETANSNTVSDKWSINTIGGRAKRHKMTLCLTERKLSSPILKMILIHIREPNSFLLGPIFIGSKAGKMA
ncbi:hypothetical protein Lalb_Chr16g0385461 [Lupinus albus]|uniref:Uncharacterized protein n=1 Tax=Lupinus albus TaxID=3870 RepID=A0A6A4NUM8_LUPAL|nr:hypothetical protein Lalb_Chr16g0385461 [Lupinus albus]